MGQSFQEKQLTVFLPKITLSFQMKIRFWKTCMYHRKRPSCSVIKDFSEEVSGDIDGCMIILILYNEICQHLEDMHKSVNKYFPDDQSTLF